MRATALRTYRELLQAAWVREVPVGPVDETLARVGRILRDADIPFAVAGGFAVIEHGYERFTTDVDLLVYARDLPRAVNAARAQGIHRPGQIAGVDQEVDVRGEPLVAVLDHGEAASDGKRDVGVPEDATDARKRLVDGSDGDLAHPGGLQELTIGAQCRGTHQAPNLPPLATDTKGSIEVVRSHDAPPRHRAFSPRPPVPRPALRPRRRPAARGPHDGARAARLGARGSCRPRLPARQHRRLARRPDLPDAPSRRRSAAPARRAGERPAGAVPERRVPE